MKRAPSPPSSSSIESAARRPRRAALLRSGIALAAAVALGVLGLIAGEWGTDRAGGVEGGRPGDPDSPAAQRLPSPVPPPSNALAPSPTAPQPAAVSTPSSAAGSLSAPVGGQIGVPRPVGAVEARTDATAASGVTAEPVAAAARARPDIADDGIVLPQAALRSGGPGYRIQLGVFGDAGNALKLYEQLAAQGYQGQIQSRVVVGPFADRATAEKALQALRRAGVGQGVLVPPERAK